jgi:hypothetical protein
MLPSVCRLLCALQLNLFSAVAQSTADVAALPPASSDSGAMSDMHP